VKNDSSRKLQQSLTSNEANCGSQTEMVRNLLMAKMVELSGGPSENGIKVESYGNYEFTQKERQPSAVLRVQVYGVCPCFKTQMIP
jgi:GTP cyclohydrolase FolE2